MMLKTQRIYRKDPMNNALGNQQATGPQNWERPDDIIQDEASEIIWRDQTCDPTTIEVSVKDGILTLKGTVATDKMKQNAEEKLKNLIGLKGLQNQLRVKSPLS